MEFGSKQEFFAQYATTPNLLMNRENPFQTEVIIRLADQTEIRVCIHQHIDYMVIAFKIKIIGCVVGRGWPEAFQGVSR
ncbi:MAG TPA: hypothetical protein VLP30_01745 [Desulfatirhabdiaceae bacterium]|nr:hypothetical protein [Desulfatirhabdiaceae bacterium]